MRRPTTLLTVTSLGALSLALYGHTPWAAEPATPAAAPQAAAEASSPAQAPAAAPVASGAPAAAAPAPPAPMGSVQPPPLPPEVQARFDEMQKRHQQQMEERNGRYEELRQRAGTAGIALPEAAPWAQQKLPEPRWLSNEEMRQQGGAFPGNLTAPPTAGFVPPQPPQPPAMPDQAMSKEQIEAMREQHYQQMRERAKARGVEMPQAPPWKQGLMSEEEHREHFEKMRNMTPAERQAFRQEMWKTMRERAKEGGIDMPEMPLCSMGEAPWLSPEARDRYQAIVNQMTAEQKEAAQAIFGGPGGPPPRMMPPAWGPQAQPGTPSQPLPGPGPGLQGFGGPPAAMPQGDWPGQRQPQGYGPGPGFGMPQGFGTGQEVPWGQGRGYGTPEGYGPQSFGGPQYPGSGYSGPQGSGPGWWGPQGYGPGSGGAGEMPPPPPGAGFGPGRSQ